MSWNYRFLESVDISLELSCFNTLFRVFFVFRLFRIFPITHMFRNGVKSKGSIFDQSRVSVPSEVSIGDGSRLTVSRYFERMHRVVIIKDDFVCRRNSPKVYGDFGADKKRKRAPGRMEKKMVRVGTRGENRVTFDLEGNLGFSISDE